MKKNYLLGLLVAGLLFTGCSQKNTEPVQCPKDTYYSFKDKVCKAFVVKKSGVVKEVRENTILISLEDNRLVEIDKQGKEYKHGDIVNILIKK